jgi:hypothetical protein
MACTDSRYARWATAQFITGSLPLAASILSSPWLIVSNDSEDLATPLTGPVTLYRGHATFTGQHRFRLFLWHRNLTGAALTYGLMLRASQQCSILNNARIEQFDVDFDGNYADRGICLAVAHLGGTLDVYNPPSLLVKSVETGPIWSRSVPSAGGGGRLVGCVLEFTVNAASETTLYFRTFASPNASRGAWNDGPAERDGHVRGWWPTSKISIPLRFEDDEPLNVNPTIPAMRQNILVDAGGPEHAVGSGFGQLTGAGHEFDVVNKGCYGADLEYVGLLRNSHPTETGRAYISLLGRGGDGDFFGAADFKDPNLDSLGVRPMREITADPSRRHFVDLLEHKPLPYITVGPDTETLEFRFMLAVGGAAATPVNVHMANQPVTATPIGGGGE